MEGDSMAKLPGELIPSSFSSSCVVSYTDNKSNDESSRLSKNNLFPTLCTMMSHECTLLVEHISVEMMASVPNTFPFDVSFRMIGSSVVVTRWNVQSFGSKGRSFLVVIRSYCFSYCFIVPALKRLTGSPISGSFNLVRRGKSISSTTFQLSFTITEASRFFCVC